MTSAADLAHAVANQLRDQPHLFDLDLDAEGDVQDVALSREGIALIERTIRDAIAEDRKSRGSP